MLSSRPDGIWGPVQHTTTPQHHHCLLSISQYLTTATAIPLVGRVVRASRAGHSILGQQQHTTAYGDTTQIRTDRHTEGEKSQGSTRTRTDSSCPLGRLVSEGVLFLSATSCGARQVVSSDSSSRLFFHPSVLLSMCFLFRTGTTLHTLNKNPVTHIHTHTQYSIPSRATSQDKAPKPKRKAAHLPRLPNGSWSFIGPWLLARSPVPSPVPPPQPSPAAGLLVIINHCTALPCPLPYTALYCTKYYISLHCTALALQSGVYE